MASSVCAPGFPSLNDWGQRVITGPNDPLLTNEPYEGRTGYLRLYWNKPSGTASLIPLLSCGIGREPVWVYTYASSSKINHHCCGGKRFDAAVVQILLVFSETSVRLPLWWFCFKALWTVLSPGRGVSLGRAAGLEAEQQELSTRSWLSETSTPCPSLVVWLVCIVNFVLSKE